MYNVSIIGAGSWGTAIAILLAKKGCNVKQWVRRPELCSQIRETKENVTYLPGVVIPSNIDISSDLEYCCKDSKILVVATPSHAVRETVTSMKAYIDNDQIIVSIAKGIENETLLRMSQIVEIILPNNKVAVLSGPCHAEEVAKDIPTAIVCSARERIIAEYVQDVFMTPKFRVYTNPDMIGVELGGALKNIIAIGAGVIDGLGFGDNTKAALMTRGIVEISRLGESLGAKKDTFAGLSGIGDLIVTCTSMHSRNRRAGIALGEGKSLDEFLGGTSMVVEGVRTTKSAYDLARKMNVEMPITQEIYNLLFNKADIRNSVINLMMRAKTHETEDVAEINGIEW
ncbi:MAG: glycerol-3-phosphate dehydrogenase [Clostridiales bacterium GWB2_37_7]|nr:MAG: glycerol-3-phosphate dehydrogenase [Clostridiales bacterium GWB2_37_7]